MPSSAERDAKCNGISLKAQLHRSLFAKEFLVTIITLVFFWHDDGEEAQVEFKQEELRNDKRPPISFGSCLT